MDPFFGAITSAITIVFFFFVAVLGGRFIASRLFREKNIRQAGSGLFALAIFAVLFFSFRA